MTDTDTRAVTLPADACQCVHVDRSSDWAPGTYPPDIWGSVVPPPGPPPGPPPDPTITTITPSSLIINGPTATLTVTGTGYTPDCVVTFSSVPYATTYVNDTTLTTDFTPEAVQTVHSAQVHNTVSDVWSNGYTFMVYASADDA